MENYYRYLVESKNELMEFVYDMLTPYIDSCLKDMFENSILIVNKNELNRKHNRNLPILHVQDVFVEFLEETKKLNSEEINQGYIVVKNSSNTPESFDMIIKSAFKSYVLFFTWDPTKKRSRIANNQIFSLLVVQDFIYKCLIETTNYFINQPKQYVEHQIDFERIIRKSINLAMRKSLPINKILEEYLRIDFVEVDIQPEHDLEKIKQQLEELMNAKNNDKPMFTQGFNQNLNQNLNQNAPIGKYGELPAREIVEESSFTPYHPENIPEIKESQDKTVQDIKQFINKQDEKSSVKQDDISSKNTTVSESNIDGTMSETSDDNNLYDTLSNKQTQEKTQTQVTVKDLKDHNKDELKQIFGGTVNENNKVFEKSGQHKKVSITKDTVDKYAKDRLSGEDKTPNSQKRESFFNELANNI